MKLLFVTSFKKPPIGKVLSASAELQSLVVSLTFKVGGYYSLIMVTSC